MSAIHEHDADTAVLFSALQLAAPVGDDHQTLTAAEHMLRILGQPAELDAA